MTRPCIPTPMGELRLRISVFSTFPSLVASAPLLKPRFYRMVFSSAATHSTAMIWVWGSRLPARSTGIYTRPPQKCSELARQQVSHVMSNIVEAMITIQRYYQNEHADDLYNLRTSSELQFLPARPSVETITERLPVSWNSI